MKITQDYLKTLDKRQISTLLGTLYENVVAVANYNKDNNAEISAIPKEAQVAREDFLSQLSLVNSYAEQILEKDCADGLSVPKNTFLFSKENKDKRLEMAEKKLFTNMSRFKESYGFGDTKDIQDYSSWREGKVSKLGKVEEMPYSNNARFCNMDYKDASWVMENPKDKVGMSAKDVALAKARVAKISVR